MLHLISQDIKAIARRTLREIFPRGDVAALAEVLHPNIVDHDGPPGAPPVIREVRDQYVNTRQPPASTAVEVRRLFREDAFIEVEAVAVIATPQPLA